MIACTIGMMVPEKLLASVTITSTTGTVTINSEKAGDLAAYIETASSDQIDALKASTIVFVGKFNSSDLEALDSKGCCVATTVDMSGAKFIAATSNSHMIFSTEDARSSYSGNIADNAQSVVGSLYKSEYGKEWVLTTTPSDKNNNGGIDAGDFKTIDFTESERNNHTSGFDLGDQIRFSQGATYYKLNSPTGNDYEREWISVPSLPDGATVKIPRSDDISHIINNTSWYLQDTNYQPINVGDYVIIESFSYYVLQNSDELGWQPVSSFTEGESHDLGGRIYASSDDMVDPASAGLYAVVGGSEKSYNNGSWGDVTEVYDYSQMKFTYWKNTITNAITSNYVPDDYLVGKTNDTFKDCSKLVSVTFNSGIVDGVSNNSSDIPDLTTVVIGANVHKIGDKAFQNISSITTLDASAAVNLTEIGEYAFSGCTSFSGDGTGNFHVPNSVQTIKKAAFESCYGIVNLYFDADSEINSIAERAFFMADEGRSGLKNVYVNVNPAREVPCAKGAFNKTDCCNQTAVGTARARLHYPPLYYDFYVGEYKSQYNGGGITQAFLDQAYANASNGWQEFMSSGILMPDGINWRTFSDELPYYVPESPATDGTVREIYLVHGYDVNKGAAILVRMKVGDIIPKNTGVIVHYTFNTAGGAALYLPPVLTDQRDDEGHIIGRIVDPDADALTEYDEELYPSDEKRYKPEGGTTYFKNYLKKLNKTRTYIDNVEIVNGRKTYRNYFFCNNDEMETTYAAYKGNEWSKECLNGWGFLRSKHDWYTISNKAYLHFPATEGFPGSESVGIGEDHTTDTNSPSSPAKLFGFITIDENGEEFDCTPVVYGIATNVQSVVETTVNDDFYYNMQGMKVDNPSKGIYVKNGKKYVVK